MCRQRRTCARSCRPQRQLPPSPQPSRRQLLTYVPSCRCRRPSRQRRDPSRPHRQTRRPRRPRTRRPRWMRWRRRWLPPRTLASRWMTSEKRSCSAHTSRTPSTMHSNAARRPHRSQSAMLALGVIVRWYPLYLLPYLLVLTYYYLLTYPCRSFVPSVLMPPGRERAYPPAARPEQRATAWDACCWVSSSTLSFRSPDSIPTVSFRSPDSMPHHLLVGVRRCAQVRAIM